MYFLNFFLFCSNKPNPNQISVSNGKMTTMNGAAGPGAYHAASGAASRACESCFGEYFDFFLLIAINRVPTVHLTDPMHYITENSCSSIN